MADFNPNNLNSDGLYALIQAMESKFSILLTEVEKRNVQRFDSQRESFNMSATTAERTVNATLLATEKTMSATLAAMDKAAEKASVAAEKRFEALNELRKMAMDWREEFARKDTVDIQFNILTVKIDKIQKTQAMMMGAIGLVGVIIMPLTVYIVHLLEYTPKG